MLPRSFIVPSYFTYGYYLVVTSILHRLFYAIKRKKKEKKKNKETNGKMSLKKRKGEGEKYTTG